MQRKLWFLTLGGSALGAFFLVMEVLGAKGAPQEAAAGAVGAACAVIPYVIARAVSELQRSKSPSGGTGP